MEKQDMVNQDMVKQDINKPTIEKDLQFLQEQADNIGIKQLDSPCRQSTNLLSFYLTELNGLNVIIKLFIAYILFNLYRKNKLKNKYILLLSLVFIIHLLIHILVIIVSLPFLCDSSNFNWKPFHGAPIFLHAFCRKKHKFYYSNPFWFIDNVIPIIILLLLLQNTKKI